MLCPAVPYAIIICKLPTEDNKQHINGAKDKQTKGGQEKFENLN